MRSGSRFGAVALLALLATPMLPLAALADTAAVDPVQSQITGALIDQGYDIVLVTHTWLGRLRIVAESDELRREIVINPNTGEVLRDYSVLMVARDSGGTHGFEDDSDNNRNGSDIAAARIVDGGADAALSGMAITGDSLAIAADPVDE